MSSPFECYVKTVEGGGPECVASAITYNEHWRNAGVPLPCGLRQCRAGEAVASILRRRLESGGQPNAGMAAVCAANYPALMTRERLPADAYVARFAQE
jgi:hypothetical protein